MPVLPDLLAPGLDIVFCGTGAGAWSARVGAYYAKPGNKFWPTLYAVGLTPRRLQPAGLSRAARARHRSDRPRRQGACRPGRTRSTHGSRRRGGAGGEDPALPAAPDRLHLKRAASLALGQPTARLPYGRCRRSRSDRREVHVLTLAIGRRRLVLDDRALARARRGEGG